MADQVNIKQAYALEDVPCGLCGSNSHRTYLKKAKELYNGIDAWFDLVKCAECGFIFTNPRPTMETIGYFYPDSAEYYQPKEESARTDLNKGKGLKGLLRSTCLAKGFGYPLEGSKDILAGLASVLERKKMLLAHVPRFVQGGRLLDIGCAWGGYLARMRALGWETFGVELNSQAAVHAREKLGLNVQCGSFDDLDFPEQYFAVIHMSMVLEHLNDPLDALRRINRLLMPGGQLILSVPDIAGLESRVFGRYSYTLQVPQHLSHFSPPTLTAFLEKAGFRVERILHQKTRKDWMKSAAYLENKWVLKLLKFAPVKSLLLSPLVSVLAGLGKTGRMSVFAVKAQQGD